MEESNEKAPEPNIKKPLKEYSCTRMLTSGNITPEGNNNKVLIEQDKDNENGNLNLTLNMLLYEEEIEFNIKGVKNGCKMPCTQYLKLFPLEELQKFNKFFSLLQTDKIFDVLQKSFEKKYDAIFQSEEELKIQLMVNIMDVMTEQISLNIPIIILSSKDELESLKESIKLMEEEKNNFKSLVNNLNKTVHDLEIKTEENKKLVLNLEKDMETKMETKEKELKKNIEEKDNLHQKNENELQSKISNNQKEIISNIEEKDNLHQNKENELEEKLIAKDKELQTQIDEYKNILQKEFQSQLEEKENRLLNYIENLNSQMEKVKEVEKYVRDTLMDKEKEVEVDEQIKYTCTRKDDNGISELYISMILLVEKIKFEIKVIKNKLTNNPKYYETYFAIKNFEKIGTYYMENGGIEALFNFLRDLLEKRKDKILVQNNKITITVKFPLGTKDEIIALNILKKNKSLEMTLNDIDLTLNDLNKANISNKDDLNDAVRDFKKRLLENVYPVGSYYWSQKDTDPGNLFGGSWSKIYGRFLFSSDSSHSVGSTGGKERVTLSTSEIPSHNHSYYKCQYDSYKRCSNADTDSNGSYRVACYSNDKNNNYEISTTSTGSSCSHENMPPYLTANCWRRTS